MMKKLCSIALALCLISSLLPASVWAAEPNGSLDLSNGSIIITETGYSQNGTDEIAYTGDYFISQTGASTPNSITVASGTHNLTLSDVAITSDSGAGISVAAETVLNLILTGNNSITGANGYAGISVTAAWTGDQYNPDNSGRLIISGAGHLTAVGGNATDNCGAGAGIGGDGFGESTNPSGGDFGVVEIMDGTVNAIGGSASSSNGVGAGIGGGGIQFSTSYGLSWIYSGNILITGGTVTATGANASYTGAAGIGSGSVNDNNSSNDSLAVPPMAIEITGGTVIANGGIGAAGIGGSANGAGSSIIIGGTAQVTANGGADGVWGGAGIGGGDNGSSAPIIIKGTARVVAAGGGAAAGIGGGGGGYATEITIQDTAEVIASSTSGSGIGGGGNHSGYESAANCGEITLNSSGTIIAYSGSTSQAIGVGYYYEPGNPLSGNNKLVIGADTGTVWMLTKTTQSSAFWGQDDIGGTFTLADGVTAIWYTHSGDAADFPAAGTLTTADTPDSANAYQWSYQNNTLSILSGDTDLYTHPYPESYALKNWAFFGAGATVPDDTIAVNPSSLDFGSVQKGTSLPAAQTVTVTNEGTQNVTVTLPTAEHYQITAGNDGWNGTSATIAPNSSVTFTVQPNSGLAVSNYDTDVTVSTQSGASVTLSLRFAVTSSSSSGGGGTPQHIITAQAENGGSISPSGSVRVARGSDKTFTITADDGYVVSDVLVDGESVGAIERYTFEAVRANHTIRAVFEAAGAMADPDDTGVSDWLNTTDHIAYLVGYPDSTFAPEQNMTRAEAAQMFYSLLKDKAVAVSVTFQDVPEDAWYARAVHAMASLGLVCGVGDGLFEPERAITRGEFSAMAMAFTNQHPEGGNGFSDVAPDDWFYPFVTGADQYGWIVGYPDGTFRPNHTITRSEVTVVVNRMLGRIADIDYLTLHQTDLVRFPDLDVAHWAYYDIMESTNSHGYQISDGIECWTELY